MKARVEDIEKVVKKGKNFRLLKDEDTTALKAESVIAKKEVSLLKKNKVEEVEIIYSRETHASLHSVHALRYRNAYASASLKSLGKQIRLLQNSVKNSDRRRVIISCEDIYVDEKNGDYTLMLEYGEEISGRKWHTIKEKMGLSKRLSFRFSEIGVIVLIDLRPRGEDYIKRFYKNSALVSFVSEYKALLKIAPDLVVSADYHIADSPAALESLYKETHSRLIVIGDAFSPDYKRALGNIKKYDKYARFMLAPNIEEIGEDEFIRQLKLHYHRIPWNN